MIIFHDAQRYELTVEAHYDTWVARLQGWRPGRLSPTTYLLRAFSTRREAIDALGRKWRVLFPDAEPLVWRDPTRRQPAAPRRQPPESRSP